MSATHLSRRTLFAASSAVAFFVAAPVRRRRGRERHVAGLGPDGPLSSDAAWQADHDRMAAELPKLLDFKGTLGQSAAALQTALQAISDADKHREPAQRLRESQGRRGHP